MQAIHPPGRHRAPRHHLPARQAGIRSGTAFLASAALAITTGLPAFAESRPTPTDSSPSLSASQRLRVGVEAVPADGRDVYGAVRVPVASGRLSYSRTADSFINNPASPIQWPFERGVPISSGFGPRTPPCRGCSGYHDGIDMTPGLGTPVRAIADGIVSSTGGPGGALGVFVKIDHVVDGRLVRSIYAHMLTGSALVAVGDRVTVGQQVGQVGNTGQSTGPHLHLGIFLDGTTPTDPFTWLTAQVGLS